MTTTPEIAARAAALVAELFPLARVFAGVPPDTTSGIQAITFRFDDRIVDARQTAEGWSFAVRGPGRGRRPGVHPTRLMKDYRAALTDVQTLQQQLHGRSIDPATITGSRWLRKLALSWHPEKPNDVPPWLREKHLWADGDGTLPRYVVHVPLKALSPDELTTEIKDPDDGAVVTFEGEPTDLTWNQFTRGDFVPSEVAARIVGIFHAQPAKRGGKIPLSPSYVQRQKAPSRA